MPDHIKPPKPLEEMTPTELADFNRRREDKLVSEFAKWRRRAVFGFVLLLVGVSWAVKRNYDAITQINAERTARTSAASSINAFVCQRDNSQDKTLAKLVAVSLQGGIGSVDTSTLDHFDLKVLGTFAKLQGGAQAQHQREVFTRELARLRMVTNCHALALELVTAAGGDPSSVKITNLAPLVTGNRHP